MQENIDPIGSSVAPRKRSLSSDEDGEHCVHACHASPDRGVEWTLIKRRRVMDHTMTQDSDEYASKGGDGAATVQHGDHTEHSQDSRRCESQTSQSNALKNSTAIRSPSPEIPFAGQSGLPSPPRTAEAAHWNRSRSPAPASQESGGRADTVGQQFKSF